MLMRAQRLLASGLLLSLCLGSASVAFADGYTFTPIVVPGATSPGDAWVYGLNNIGQVVGTSSQGGFLDSGGSFTIINGPGGVFAYLRGFYDWGPIVGFSLNSTN